jgi:hypothetical protein
MRVGAQTVVATFSVRNECARCCSNEPGCRFPRAERVEAIGVTELDFELVVEALLVAVLPGQPFLLREIATSSDMRKARVAFGLYSAPLSE